MNWETLRTNPTFQRIFYGSRGKDAMRDYTSHEYRSDLLLAVLIGIVGGYGAVGFRWAILGVQWVSFQALDPTVDYLLTLPWYWRFLLPVIGGAIIGPITTKFASEAKGHGVPEVMAAVGVRGGVIRPRVVAAKVVASAICIGTGGSAGREGPIVQIGSAFASTLGQLLKLNPRRMRTFVGCGAAAAIGATFNAPVAGMLFAMEIILGGFSIAHMSPIVIASVMATAVSRWHLGNEPAFKIPGYTMAGPFELIPYAVLGVAAAFVGVLFTLSLHSTEHFFDKKLKIPSGVKPVIGGLFVGTLGAIGLPHVFGVGYDMIDLALQGALPLSLLALLVFAKIAATSATIGSGGSGGIFAPSLFMGAMLGGVVWHGAHAVTPNLVVENYGAYALVGMAAVVAATTRAPLQAILILFELTGGYEVILPLMLSSILAVVVGNILMQDSIYTIKLRAKGIVLRKGKEINILRDLKVHEVMRPEYHAVPYNMRLRPLLDSISETTKHQTVFVMDKHDKLKGYISYHEIRAVLFDVEALEPVLVANDIANLEIAGVTPDDNLDLVTRLFARKNLDELPVVDPVDPTRLIGTIYRGDVTEAYNTAVMKRDLLGTVSESVSESHRFSHAQLAPGYSMAEIEVPAHFSDKDLRTLDLRNKYGVTVILVRRHTHHMEGGGSGIVPTADLVLQNGDVLLISGPQEDVEKLASV